MNQITKEALAPLVYQIAIEERILQNLDEARDLESKLRIFDQASYERILRHRADSLRKKSTGQPVAPFSPEFYAGQADTIESIIKDLPSILA